MEKMKKKRNPVETANIISKLFFWWTIRLFYKGTKGDLCMDDIYDPLKSDESEYITDRLESEWKKELEKLEKLEYAVDDDGKKKKNSPRPSLGRAIVRLFWLPYFISGLFALLQCAVLRTLQPILQSQIIRFFEPGPNAIGRSEAIIYASGLVVTTLVIVFILHHMNLFVQRIGMRIRVACSSLIYRKSLRLSQTALNQTAAGQVINLLSNDVNRFDYLPLFLNFIWIMPIQLVVVGFIMWKSIGVASTFVGIGSLLIFSFPMVGWFSILGGRLRGVIAQLSDRRVQLMSELISGIQVVKTYAWEKPFDKIVSYIRISEINKIKLSSYLRGLYLSVMIFTERTCLFLTIMAFVLMGNSLTAEISFQLATYFNILQLVTAIFFPQALILLGEAMVSIRRLEEFLLLEDISKDEVVKEKKIEYSKIIRDIDYNKTNDKHKAVVVELNRLSANWVVGQLPPTLCEVSLKIEGGKLCSLIGPVGAGKSSLLHILLRELPIGAGTVTLHQMNNEKFLESQSKRGYICDNPKLSISYASQDAWLFTGTVRENILFGQIYDQSRYQKVTTVCSLVRDFKQLPYGDMTIVGDRGASLSGGQRARVNLARAIYREADIYLLDDPLSAVDARVAHRLFKDCILGYLEGKTRILVTHQLHFLQQSDIIVVLERGFVKHQGTYDYLTSTSDDFNDMLNRIKEEDDEFTTVGGNSNENLTETVFSEIEELKNEDLIHRRSRRRSSTKSFARKASIRSVESYYFAEDEENERAAAEAKLRNQGEAMESGKLSLKVYGRYFRHGGGIFILILLIFNFAIAQIITSGADYWLRYWTNIEAVRNALHDPTGNSRVTSSEYLAEVNNTFFENFGLLDSDGLIPSNWAIYIYAGCILGCILLTISRCILFMFICMRASIKLHNEMFSNLLNATMLFFNTNPLGRILNRFSKDVGAMDELIPKLMLEAFQITLVVIGVLSMVVIVNFVMIVPIIVIGIIFYKVRTVFLNTAQDIKRLEGNAKSPVFSHVDATLNGLTTIRSRGEDIQTMLRKEFDKFQDKHTGTWYLLLATASAFGLLLDIISCLFIACVCFSFIAMDPESTTGGSVGLAISQSLILTGMLQYGVRQTADVQSQMTAIERILQYTDLPKEGPMQSKNPPPPSWPAFGRVQLKNVFMTYKINDPPVLKNLNIIIEAGWKVGVVGRTGAGKSSLISALFRLTGDGLQGEIIIDGRDTSTIGLQELRSSISIIPQEPVLFSQTLRYNLDPFGKYPDSALWDALREVELADYSLDQKVTEGGTNFSVGQRQLICLARAILRNNKILILDEATANIDTRTDALIQKTIRLKFDNCTVITIAHRLNTIIDSDRVLVMDDGRMVEFDTPFELLVEKPDSIFAKMVAQTGATMAEDLIQQATLAYRKRTSISNSTLQE